ncbi:hypothetical protein TNIN_153251 [Trichonephila inaurata madagascariensis]|uniref:Uncharacterized protein n=1 Tax=Trichonephila inaurata madagascariensis TaxID=2747483 RepID=A0A8X6XSF8_9ARAC|nr:hypothetical protein TNIN_153251 [Trichonephila inaurata madagascariensis]
MTRIGRTLPPDWHLSIPTSSRQSPVRLVPDRFPLSPRSDGPSSSESTTVDSRPTRTRRVPLVRRHPPLPPNLSVSTPEREKKKHYTANTRRRQTAGEYWLYTAPSGPNPSKSHGRLPSNSHRSLRVRSSESPSVDTEFNSAHNTAGANPRSRYYHHPVQISVKAHGPSANSTSADPPEFQSSRRSNSNYSSVTQVQFPNPRKSTPPNFPPVSFHRSRGPNSPSNSPRVPSVPSRNQGSSSVPIPPGPLPSVHSLVLWVSTSQVPSPVHFSYQVPRSRSIPVVQSPQSSRSNRLPVSSPRVYRSNLPSIKSTSRLKVRPTPVPRLGSNSVSPPPSLSQGPTPPVNSPLSSVQSSPGRSKSTRTKVPTPVGPTSDPTSILLGVNSRSDLALPIRRSDSAPPVPGRRPRSTSASINAVRSPTARLPPGPPGRPPALVSNPPRRFVQLARPDSTPHGDRGRPPGSAGLNPPPVQQSDSVQSSPSPPGLVPPSRPSASSRTVAPRSPPGPSLLGPDLALPIPAERDGRLPPASDRPSSVPSFRRRVAPPRPFGPSARTSAGPFPPVEALPDRQRTDRRRTSVRRFQNTSRGGPAGPARVSGRRMSLSRSHCGGCSATYDTPSRWNVVCRRLCARTPHTRPEAGSSRQGPRVLWGSPCKSRS